MSSVMPTVACPRRSLNQVHDVAGCKVLAGVLVQGLVELPDQLLEDRAHRRVVNGVGVEVNVLEAFQHLEEEPRLVELADCVVEVELLQYLAHVGAEASGFAFCPSGLEVGRLRLGDGCQECARHLAKKGTSGKVSRPRWRVVSRCTSGLRTTPHGTCATGCPSETLAVRGAPSAKKAPRPARPKT